MPDSHRWRFFRAGGVDQVVLDRGDDLLHLGEFDLKNWVALACPVQGVAWDPRLTRMLDRDQDGRIRPPEVQQAVAWACAVLDADLLVRGGDSLRLEEVRSDTPEGQRIAAAVRRVLVGLGKAETDALTLEDVRQAEAELAKAPFNGDGRVPAASLEDPWLQGVAKDLLAVMGGETDASGQPGFTREKVEAFFQALEAYAVWYEPARDPQSPLQPLGADTGEAFAALKAVRDKVEDWFMRCRLAAFDSRAIPFLGRTEEDWKALAARDLSQDRADLASFPLARVEVGRSLPLGAGCNPAWQDAIHALRTRVIDPLLGPGKTSLSEVEWKDLLARFAPYEAWKARQPGTTVESLGIGRVDEILASDARARLLEAIDRDLALAPEVEARQDVERILLYRRDLVHFLHNFVSFQDFYRRKTPAFQAGRLFLDGRSFDLCIPVLDPARHGTLAAMAGMYLIYCECTRPSGEKRHVVAAVTDGDSDNLMVGRNGVFYDRDGRDWDATITKIVENPISLRQAFWSPYKKLVRMIEEQVARRAAAAEAASSERLAKGAETLVASGAEPAKATPPPPKKIDVGTVAALGVAVGGITAALGAMLQVFFGLGFFMPLGILALMLVISGPSVFIAAMKLRKRNLGPLLDAGGWAVNALTRVSIPLGKSLTLLHQLPPGSERSLKDPFAPRRRRWPWVLLVLAILAALGGVAWKAGWLDGVRASLAPTAPVTGEATPPPSPGP
ncbi:MAG TPA: hypothetical protein PLQ97_13425 [Myxococcota bacterium]|mgnify:CR=1 FL=1|nr:hypothetical protein [Myxococcota bacterium]HQK52227.1 hypothetical protein [Myxococcota bacterium]